MSKKTTRSRKRRRDPQLLREDALRPCSYLGYDRDQLGIHFMGRGAIELAESQFRRAAWLNPFEPLFKVHWARALITLRRTVLAHQIIRDLLASEPTNRDALALWRQYWREQPLPTVAPNQDASPSSPSRRNG